MPSVGLLLVFDDAFGDEFISTWIFLYSFDPFDCFVFLFFDGDTRPMGLCSTRSSLVFPFRLRRAFSFLSSLTIFFFTGERATALIMSLRSLIIVFSCSSAFWSSNNTRLGISGGCCIVAILDHCTPMTDGSRNIESAQNYY